MGKKNKSQKTNAPADMSQFTVYTDGGCAVNPGGPGGYGIVIIDNTTGELRELSGGVRSTTNNRMEMMAACVALEALPANASVTLHSDSQYFLNCFIGVWARKKNHDLWKRVDAAAKGKDIEIVWVRGHNGDPMNERCDELATIAMSGDNLPDDVGYIPETGKTAASAKQRKDEAPKPRPQSGNSMGQSVSVPAEFSKKIPHVPAKDYAEEHGVSKDCARAIIQFGCEDKHSFKSYTSLRTGGIDSWSRKKPEEIAELIPNAVKAYSICKEHLGDGKDAVTALRWFARGLPLADCIRKVYVDREVADNARP